jgi:hypothetical protein
MIKNTFLVPVRRTWPFRKHAQSGVISKLAARMRTTSRKRKENIPPDGSQFRNVRHRQCKPGLRLSHSAGTVSVHYDLPQKVAMRRTSALWEKRKAKNSAVEVSTARNPYSPKIKSCEADHSPPSSVEVENVWSYTSIPQYILTSTDLS